ncbi:DNA translocase FtsK [Nonomuraea sp. CA-143628]|uniref:DNA translocase FtsK n=1 Tax=Nonomuraea sp. CA-143628 TaxID=3239997 RepID=UPI003D8E79CE
MSSIGHPFEYADDVEREHARRLAAARQAMAAEFSPDYPPFDQLTPGAQEASMVDACLYLRAGRRAGVFAFDVPDTTPRGRLTALLGDARDDGQDDSAGSTLEQELERLGKALFDSIDRLDDHIERRAREVAAPEIAAAERRAAAAEQRAEQAEQAHEQRLGDLRAELVRQMNVMDRRLDQLLWLSQYLPAPLRELALPMPSELTALASKLPARWRAMTARRASPDYDPAADGELQLLAEGITLVVGSQSAARFQTSMRIGFAKAQTLLKRMEELGVVSPLAGTKRKVLVEPEALPGLLASLGVTVDETRERR